MFFKKLFAAFTKSERIIFLAAIAGAAACLITLAGIGIARATKSVPAAGGSYTEGIVGQPEYVNPVLASSETDLELARMVYDNLYSIADSVTSSADQRTWTVRLKDGLTWQDGQKLTADDVIFTVQSIQNKDADSPLYASWQNVQASRASELEVQFTLNAPYSFFTNTLKNLYIVPKHIFADTPPGNWRLSDYNLKPVGSGPYQFLSYNKDAEGFITSYTLQAAKQTSDAKPLIQDFTFRFFNDENALVLAFNAAQIDGFGGVTPETLIAIDRPYNLYSWRTSSYYSVFFNQSNNIALQDPAVREALSAAVDRSALITAAFGSPSAANSSAVGAIPDYGPIPPDAPYALPDPSSTSAGASATDASSTDAVPTPAVLAGHILDNAGWTVSTSTGFRAKTIGKSAIPLAITLVVPNIDFLSKTAEYLRNAWQAIGVQVTVTPTAPSDIAANTIKNRDYEALLFGNALGPSSDLYAFWDSSQRFYPGLNLAIYSDGETDRNIETARMVSSTDRVAADLAIAQQDIENAYPAVFLYSPDYLYAAGKNVQGVATGGILSDPSDRFLQIPQWYLNTARVLK